MTDPDRLERLLGGDELGWLRDRVRRRLERGESLDTTVTLTRANPQQRAAVHRLLGRRPRSGNTLTVSLPAVDEVLRRSGACHDGLAAAIIALTGEVTDRTGAAARQDRAWRAAFAPLESAVEARPKLSAWLRHLHDTGLVRRLAGTPEAAAPLLANLVNVLDNLPAHGEPLGRFAARVAGGAHSLDPDCPLTTLTIGAAAALSGLPAGTGAQWRREVWAAVGLLTNEVSSTVLTLGLPGDSRSPTGRALGCWQEAGQPVVLTFRQLAQDAPQMAVRDVHVCENPVVISAAADRLGSDTRPLVCTNGQPGIAALHLLRRLTDAAAQLHYHGDFDWGGLRIGNTVFDRVAAKPWRFGTGDYLAAARNGLPLTGRPATAHWDDQLGTAMRAAGVAVEEEHVLDTLIEDLAR